MSRHEPPAAGPRPAANELDRLETCDTADWKSAVRLGTAAQAVWRAASVIFLAGLLAGTNGCTHIAARKHQVETKLAEESRVLTTAVVETLQAQSATNRDAHSTVALTLAKQDQRIEGLPEKPLAVHQLITEENHHAGLGEGDAGRGTGGGEPATAALRERFTAQDRLIAHERLAERKLVERGIEQEATRNARISFWTRLLGFGGVGLGGLVALLVFLPVSIPFVGRLLAWLVARLPALAGLAGVVSVKAFDAVVKGVERFKAAAVEKDSRPTDEKAASLPAVTAPLSAPPPAQLLRHLSSALDADHKALVAKRRIAQSLPNRKSQIAN